MENSILQVIFRTILVMFYYHEIPNSGYNQLFMEITY